MSVIRNEYVSVCLASFQIMIMRKNEKNIGHIHAIFLFGPECRLHSNFIAYSFFVFFVNIEQLEANLLKTA